jgi:hypothetical protein
VPPLAGWIKIHDRYQERAECTQKDVKNEGRSDYVYENKDNDDKMTEDLAGFLPKTHRFRDNGRQSIGFLPENVSICGIDSATDPHPPVSGQRSFAGGEPWRQGCSSGRRAFKLAAKGSAPQLGGSLHGTAGYDATVYVIG